MLSTSSCNPPRVPRFRKWGKTDPVKTDRTIERSQWNHVELALYARALEIDRKQLIELVQLLRRELASLHAAGEMPATVADAIRQLLRVLEEHPLRQ